MAANYRTIVIGHEPQEVIVVEESGTTQRVILKSLLTLADQRNMDLVEDTGTGSTFAQKLESTVLKNGKTAADTYQNLIVNTIEYSQRIGEVHFTPTQIPIAGNSGTFITNIFPFQKERHYISVRFYDGSDNLIPISDITAGQVTISASETPDEQYETVTNGTILFDGTSGYARPVVSGSYRNLRVNLSGLVSSTPIDHAVVLANSFE